MAETNESVIDDGDPVKPATEERYTCPKTGAHFHFDDMCQRLNKLQKKRD